MIKRVFFIVFAMLSSQLWGQELTTKSKKAASFYQEGQKMMETLQFNEAIISLQKAVTIDTSFIEGYILLAEALVENNQDSLAVVNYRKALSINPYFRVMTWIEFAATAIDIGDYSTAQHAANQFLSKAKTQGKWQLKAKLIKDKCTFALEALKHPVPFNPKRMSDNINSEFDDYWPSLSADEQTLVFNRLLPVNATKPLSVTNRQEDFYISYKKDSLWQKASNLGPPINTSANEGAQTISIDGKKMYFTGCGWIGGQGRCDLWFSMMINDKWIPPVNVGRPVNGMYQEKQPCISSDGLTLYFASDRVGGSGGYDLWSSTMDSTGHWKEPRNMGPNINTPFNEQSPFIHFDNQTFYFSSDGWPGMGSMDIYVSKKTGDTTWSPSMNIGYPINTFKDEIGLIVNAKGELAYFSSDRPGSQRRDIYEFELYKNAQPVMVNYMKGKVFDSLTRKPVAARFELIDLNNSEVISQSKASKNGEFLVCIPTNRDYALNVSAKGYLFYSANFSMTGEHSQTKPYLVDVALQSIQSGTKIVLRNIFFEVNAYELKNTSMAELSKVIEFMNYNPSLNIEISGHTDNTGSMDYNMKLSENRAKSVMDYLVKKGIEPARLKYKGYGPTQPISDNATEEGRALNRRTEMKII